MKIELTLDAEQSSALAGMVASSNEADGRRLTAEEYMAEHCMGAINNAVNQAFEASAQSLVEMAKAAPYEKRIALIELVQSQLS